jgi:tripartite-type tricarboxylate transporter receptor subunit TctC
VLAQHLSDALKQPFVVEDWPGAGSIIGTDAVAKSPPDGYTLLAMSNTHTTNESLVPNSVPVDARLRAVAGINYSDLLMVIHRRCRRRTSRSSSPMPNRSRASSTTPRRHRHALSHGGRAVQSHERHQLVHVPHKASGEMRNSVIGAHVQMAFDAITTMASNVRPAGARLGTSASKRSTVLPDVPTIAEAGVPGYDSIHLARHHGAGRHAQGDRRQAQRRDQQAITRPVWKSMST